MLLLKAALLWALCRITGRSHIVSTQTALLLAQAGEFGFVLFGLAHMLGLMDGELYQLLLLVIALSMAATPVLVRLGHWLGRAPASAPPEAAHPSEPIPALRNHAIVAGFGRFSSTLAHILTKANLPYLVLEVDPTRVARARALIYPVFYGDASRTEVLRSAGAADASMVVLALDQMESIGKAVVTVREAFPDLAIYARAWDVDAAQRLHAMGVTYAIPETMASGLQLAGDLLRASGIPPEEALHLVDEARDERQRKIARPLRPERQARFKDILLVLTPGVEETTALDHAAALAEDNRAALTVVEVLSEATAGVERDEHGVSSPDELDEEMAASRRKRLEDLVSHLRGRLEVQTKLLFGGPHEAITREVVSNERDLVKGGRREELIRLAVSLEADLVVVGCAGRSGIAALIVESTAETLAKGLDCSVLVVKPPGFVTPFVVEEP